MGIIYVSDIRSYAYHGCNEEESRIGGTYITDIEISTDFESAALTDDLSKTVDYVAVYETVKMQMEIRSKLIETLANRIGDELLKKNPQIQAVTVKVTKLHPPINGDVGKVSAKITKNR